MRAGSSAFFFGCFLFKPTFYMIKDKNYVAPTLFGEEEIPHEIRKEWEGMPECINQDLTASKQLIVSFRNSEDYKAFAELVGQRLTPKTKSIWFPQVEISKYMDKQYKFTPENEDNT